MVDMLNKNNIEAHLEVAIDNNEIDRMVHTHRPTHVIIEALWVTPTKFAVLTKLHPKVKWIIRLHSELPFIASEGIAMDWLGEYLKYKEVIIGVNAPRMTNNLRIYLDAIGQRSNLDRVCYLPNYYPFSDIKPKKIDKTKEHVDISCFGAVRPLKNHLPQALAAVKFANAIGKKLRFHINTGRIEMKAEPIMNNLKGMFGHLTEHGFEMVCHEWCPREDFLKICAQMDIGMQCNFSETFNIVSADLISQGVPILGTGEIPWIHTRWVADPNGVINMAYALEVIYNYAETNVEDNRKCLNYYCLESEKIWVDYFGRA